MGRVIGHDVFPIERISVFQRFPYFGCFVLIWKQNNNNNNLNLTWEYLSDLGDSTNSNQNLDLVSQIQPIKGQVYV